MKKLILLFAVAAALCASTVFAATVYHATTPEEFFAAISYDADTINALSVGIACLGGDMGVWPTNSMHWVEGTDQYGDYLLGTLSATDTLATGAPAGPFKILDIVGLETAYNINQMKPEAQVEGSVSNLIGKLLKEKIDKGETGVNAGIGFYNYKK